jgi:hypothetical protein
MILAKVDFVPAGSMPAYMTTGNLRKLKKVNE